MRVKSKVRTLGYSSAAMAAYNLHRKRTNKCTTGSLCIALTSGPSSLQERATARRRSSEAEKRANFRH